MKCYRENRGKGNDIAVTSRAYLILFEKYNIDLREDLMPVIDIMQMLGGNPFKETHFVSQAKCDEVFDKD